MKVKEVKLFLFADDMLAYVENPKDSGKKNYGTGRVPSQK